MRSRVEFLRKLPSVSRLSDSMVGKPEKFLLIYDSQLEKKPGFKDWIKKYPYSYRVKAGESLKSLDQFPSHIKKIFKVISPFSAKSLCIVGIGGGSVGDFAGFVASVLKRGVQLVHMPTTLLAAMDSAHGGKTALNVGDLKNQVGSFYAAESVLIARHFFEELPKEQIQSSLGELCKMAFIEGGSLLEELHGAKNLDLDFIWKNLPQVIEAKYKWVEKDPYEKTGERQVLNLGHSLGHVLEGYFGIPHGTAVGEGLLFSCLWSHHQGYLPASEKDKAIEILVNKLEFLAPPDFAKKHRLLSESKLNRFILEDKKMLDTQNLNFVFLEKLGLPFSKKMAIQSFVTETQRQGWTRL